MVDIAGAVSYPTESDDFLVTILIGGVLTILSFLVIPIILVTGYLVSIAKARFDGQPDPPSFDNWETLLLDGLKATVIGFVYMLVPLLVAGALLGGSLVSIATGSRGGAALGIGGILGAFLLTSVLFLLFGYVAAAAVLNFAYEGSIDAGFDFGRITTLVTSGDYLVAWVVVIAVNIVVGLVNGILGIVPILGSIAGLFIAFYGQMVGAHLWADGYIDTFDLESTPEAEPPTRTETI